MMNTDDGLEEDFYESGATPSYLDENDLDGVCFAQPHASAVPRQP